MVDRGQRPVIDPGQVQDMRQDRSAWVLELCQHDIRLKLLQMPHPPESALAEAPRWVESSCNPGDFIAAHMHTVFAEEQGDEAAAPSAG